MPEAHPPTVARPTPRRRWFQFSLRTLMAVTLSGVGLGFLGSAVQRACRQRPPIDKVEKAGRSILHDYHFIVDANGDLNAAPPVGRWLRQCIGSGIPCIGMDSPDPPASTPESPDRISQEQAKQMIYAFLSSKEAKGSAWIVASKAVIEKRKMIIDEKSGEYIWGPWRVDPAANTVILQTSADIKIGYRLDAKVERIEGKFAITGVKIIVSRNFRK